MFRDQRSCDAVGEWTQKSEAWSLKDRLQNICKAACVIWSRLNQVCLRWRACCRYSDVTPVVLLICVLGLTDRRPALKSADTRFHFPSVQNQSLRRFWSRWHQHHLQHNLSANLTDQYKDEVFGPNTNIQTLTSCRTDQKHTECSFKRFT